MTAEREIFAVRRERHRLRETLEVLHPRMQSLAHRPSSERGVYYQPRPRAVCRPARTRRRGRASPATSTTLPAPGRVSGRTNFTPPRFRRYGSHRPAQPPANGRRRTPRRPRQRAPTSRGRNQHRRRRRNRWLRRRRRFVVRAINRRCGRHDCGTRRYAPPAASASIGRPNSIARRARPDRMASRDDVAFRLRTHTASSACRTSVSVDVRNAARLGHLARISRPVIRFLAETLLRQCNQLWVGARSIEHGECVASCRARWLSTRISIAFSPT